jgi:hypothetical protein
MTINFSSLSLTSFHEPSEDVVTDPEGFSTIDGIFGPDSAERTGADDDDATDEGDATDDADDCVVVEMTFLKSWFVILLLN